MDDVSCKFCHGTGWQGKCFCCAGDGTHDSKDPLDVSECVEDVREKEGKSAVHRS